MATESSPVNTETDLVLTRLVDLPKESLWRAWTEPELLKQWFAPAPWSVTQCRIDLRPGGVFHTTMRSPEGQEFPGSGCYLDLVPNERIVFTDALTEGYRPTQSPFFTCILTFESAGTQTRYRAVAKHKDEATRKQHEDMGFHSGWGQCLDQLVALMSGR